MRMCDDGVHMSTQAPFDISAPKKATNVSINTDLLQQAKALKINLSQVLEQKLAEIVLEHRRQQWLAENRAALEDANAYVERHGTFSDGLRQF